MKETKFDFDAFDDKVYYYYLAFQGALQKTKDHKTESLIQTNFFQSVLKNAMECLLQSKAARKIPVKLIVTILENKGILSAQEAKDAMKICDIRDKLAHNIEFGTIEKELGEIIRTMHLGFRIVEPEEDESHLDSFIQAIRSIAKKSLTWDIYQRLDYVCYNLGVHINGEIYEIREPNPLVATGYEPPLTEKELQESRDLDYHSNNKIP